jgi:hypothetical protein
MNGFVADTAKRETGAIRKYSLSKDNSLEKDTSHPASS